MRIGLMRIRAALGIGVTWAVAWAPLGAITSWVGGTFLGFQLGVIATNYAVTFSVLGLIGGTIFSGVLRLAEGHRSFGALSLPRFVAWGAIGGLALGALAVTAGFLDAGLNILGTAIIGVSTLLGAGSAVSALVVARGARIPCYLLMARCARFFDRLQASLGVRSHTAVVARPIS